MIYALLSIGDKLTEIIKDAIGVSLSEFLINLFATILLIVIIRFFFWNKVTDFLDKKKESIKKDYTANEKIKEETKLLQEQAEAAVSESKAKAQEIIRDSRTAAERQKSEILMGAKEESARIISESRETAEREKEEIIKEAKNEVIDLASLIASKMIDESVDQEKYNDKVLKELDK